MNTVTDNYVAMRRPWLNRNGESRYNRVLEDGSVDPCGRPSEIRALLTPEEWTIVDEAAMRGFNEHCPSLSRFEVGVDVSCWDRMLVEKKRRSNTRASNMQPTYELVGIPLPIISADFHFPERWIEVMRRRLHDRETRLRFYDVTFAEVAGRKVGRRLEELLQEARPGAHLIRGQSPVVIRWTVRDGEGQSVEGFKFLCCYVADALQEGDEYCLDRI